MSNKNTKDKKNTKRVVKNVAQIFKPEDNRSKLLNVDKAAWLENRLEAESNKNPILSSSDVIDILDTFIKSEESFVRATNISNVVDINEADTISYFISPFIKKLAPKLSVLNEYKIFELKSRLDAVIYDAAINNKSDKDANFVFMEYKKAGLWTGKNGAKARSIYELAHEHGLLQKHHKDELKHVLKINVAKQMILYLEATKTIGGGNTSAGIITNGLSYYFMFNDGNDPTACNQSWSILYSIDLAEIVERYINGGYCDIQEAEIKLNTFIDLIYKFISNKKRKEFISWYRGIYNIYETGLATIYSNPDLEEGYKKYKKLNNNNPVSPYYDFEKFAPN